MKLCGYIAVTCITIKPLFNDSMTLPEAVVFTRISAIDHGVL